MQIEKSFLGKGWGFPPEFDTFTKEVKMVSEEEDIQESLRILLLTSPGERTMEPSYGCGLRSKVFENISEGTLTEIKDLIERAILFFEPRITLNRIDVSYGPENGAAIGSPVNGTDGREVRLEGLIHLLIDYTVRATNTRSNMVYPFYLLEGTDLRPSDRAATEPQGEAVG